MCISLTQTDMTCIGYVVGKSNLYKAACSSLAVIFLSLYLYFFLFLLNNPLIEKVSPPPPQCRVHCVPLGRLSKHSVHLQGA